LGRQRNISVAKVIQLWQMMRKEQWRRRMGNFLVSFSLIFRWQVADASVRMSLGESALIWMKLWLRISLVLQLSRSRRSKSCVDISLVHRWRFAGVSALIISSIPFWTLRLPILTTEKILVLIFHQWRFQLLHLPLRSKSFVSHSLVNR
jgi:hypothetical protein